MTSITLPRSNTAAGIAYHQQGEGKPIILIHGVGLRAESWYQQVDALSEQYKVYAIDQPGHGESQRLAKGDATLADYSHAIYQFAETVVQEEAIWVGHSLGALITLDVMQRYPSMCLAAAALSAIFQREPEAQQAVRARAEVLMDLVVQGKSEALEDMASAPLLRWFGNPPQGDEKAMADACRQWLEEGDRLGYAMAYSVFAQQNGPLPSVLSSLSQPTLLLTGSEDLNSTPKMSEQIATHMPQAKSVVVDGAKHMLPMTHAERVNTELLDFLSSC